jgi:hypothetical protein
MHFPVAVKVAKSRMIPLLRCQSKLFRLPVAFRFDNAP